VRLTRAIEQMASGIAGTEARLSAAEQRARNAEMQADEAENALKLFEEAIRTRILEKRFDGSGGRATLPPSLGHKKSGSASSRFYAQRNVYLMMLLNEVV
jgi:hypothetical protein